MGVIFAAQSPRCVTLQTAEQIASSIPAWISLIGVFVEPRTADVARAREAGYVPQFSGHEPPDRCRLLAAGPYIKVFHLPARAMSGDGMPDAAEVERLTSEAQTYAGATWMFDTAWGGRHGGTGRTFDWDAVGAVAKAFPIVVSGGLTPANVGACIERVRPFGVDVRSGIETDGVKNVAKMRAFVRAVKEG